MAGTGVVAAGAADEQTLATAHAALRKTPGVQFDFGQLVTPEPPSWIGPLLEFLRLIGPVLKYLFWGGVVIGVALILYFFLRELVPERWFRRSARHVATDFQPAAETARALLQDADGLAQAGRFEEAIHLLLFRSIDDLVSRRPGVVKPALTSRDIASLAVLPADARAAFARLAEAVERTFFGGRPAGAETFQAARSDYEAFAFAEGWR
ncbi:MAG: hypothetical protein DI570_00295 [Phenylobacterium zucineum]|nr:MAG: hypothetical protein DI570_00295 [Phenylobacterium zucineum]